MFGSGRNDGSWTGWVCDQDSMKTISKQIDPMGYLERYPKSKASNLNTLFTGFALFHHGEWFILDKRGSELVKKAIARSSASNGFFVTVQGVRKGNKIKVSAVLDKTAVNAPLPASKFDQNRTIRADFRLMGI